MKNLIRKWLGLTSIDSRLYALETDTITGQLKRDLTDLQSEFQNTQRAWRLLYSAQRGLADYLGLQEWRDHIPDTSHRLNEEPTIEVIRYKKSHAKTSKVSKL